MAYVIKFGLAREGIFTQIEMFQPLVEFIAANSRIVDLTAGILFPLFILTVIELLGKTEHPGWERVEESSRSFHDLPAATSSTLPAKMVAISLTVIAVLMVGLAIFDREEAGILVSLAVVLGLIAGALQYSIRVKEKTS